MEEGSKDNHRSFIPKPAMPLYRSCLKLNNLVSIVAMVAYSKQLVMVHNNPNPHGYHGTYTIKKPTVKQGSPNNSEPQ
jgi:hypothetical protein